MKNSPDLIHKYSVPIEFLNERTFSFRVICEHLQDILSRQSGNKAIFE